ncbi:hypothetical protein WJX72_010131 [[Myrmecia] bisecta]|uniref:Uncharacterized protein n=1 Tax=[Myrmecia] bisecta TaxID=41462 RepID=A0AAW1QTI9_9CHLO
MADCGPGAEPFIAKWLLDCIYSKRDMAGFAVGMLSIACWMVAQIPQLITNMKNKSAEALSAWFLAQWLLGDTCNLIGCLLNGDQLPTVTYTAMYFICMDVVMMMQYIYYGSLQRRLAHEESLSPVEGVTSRHWSRAARPTRVLACLALLMVVHLQWSGGATWSMASGLPEAGVVLNRRRLLWEWLPWWHWHHRIHHFLQQDRPLWARHMGTVIGYISSCFYLCSRVSQIVRNFSRKSAEGLALSMFACAITANLCYGLGILIRSYTLADLVSSAPWIIGSLGTVALDITIFTQGKSYGRRAAKEEQEEPLLGSPSAHAHA